MEQTSREKRIAQLEAKSAGPGLSDDEFAELRQLKHGAFKALPDLGAAGLKNIDTALTNLFKAAAHAKCAFEQGFYIEVLALRSQTAELLLRYFLALRYRMTPSFPVDDTKPLGRLINEAEEADLEASIVADLRNFNKDRITGVHHYLLGATTYEALRDVCERSSGLNGSLAAAIAGEFGTPV